MTKTILALVAGLALSGCSMVTSDRPLFGAADSTGAPVLRPGVWAMPGEANCTFDPKAPSATWPKCANPTVVSATTFSNGGAPGEGPQTLAYLLAGGDPPVLQVAAPVGEKDGPAIIYAGLRPTAFDDRKQVTALKVWLALCSKPVTSGGDGVARPTNLLPGLTLRPGGGQECVAKEKGPVRNAVKQSEIWLASGGKNDFSLDARWVRDGEK